MNFRAFFCPLFLFFFSIHATAATGIFCSQTFNVYGPAYASNVSDRLARTAEELSRSPCESMQFQELWRESHFEEFASGLYHKGMTIIRADRLRQDSSIIGLASAFSGNVLWAKSALFRINNQSGVIDWIRDLSGVQKGYTLMEVELSRGISPVFANLHTHPGDEAIRLAQIVQLIDESFAITASGEKPFILTGDLNASPDSLEVSLLKDVLLLRDSFAEVNGGYNGICTYCGNNPLSWSDEDRVIDFVLVRNGPDLRLLTESSEVNLRGEKDYPLSDHFGLRSRIQWQQREDRPLSPDDARVSERWKRAASALGKAEKILAAKGRAFRGIASTAHELKKRFREGNLPAVAQRIFLIP